MANEQIKDQTEQTAPLAADVVAMDKASTGVTYKLKLSRIFDVISLLTAKTTLTGNDVFAIGDSAAFGVGKGITWTNILAALSPTIAISKQFILTNFNPTTTSGFTRGTQIETTTNKVNIVNNSFPNGSQTYGFINFPLPSDYDGGTVTASFYWTANSATANSVIWGLQAVAFADNGALDTAYGTAQEVTDANGSSAYTTRISATSSAITIAGTPTAGKLVSWRVYRLGSGSDNLAVAASLISVVVNYTRA